MSSFISLYNQINYNIKKALLIIENDKKEIEILKSDNQKLTDEVESLQKQVEEFRQKLKLITITNTILKKEDKKDTQKLITDLVREIDNCLLLLKNDNDK